MMAKESISLKKYYVKCLFLLALTMSAFCWNAAPGFSPIQSQKIQTESVIGAQQQQVKQLLYHADHLPLTTTVDSGFRTIYSSALWSYNQTVLVFLRQHQYAIALFEPFRLFSLPKIIPPHIDSFLS
ncbi:hypothetical protein [Pedobacter gandavensis]|uniref:hypothetical protein n=1 Tax=Pedobacter gandavensis TaxID=2679963 RepID=UPI002931527F|nr:hypothetical protein [Pedobacter gandavensis]